MSGVYRIQLNNNFMDIKYMYINEKSNILDHYSDVLVVFLSKKLAYPTGFDGSHMIDQASRHLYSILFLYGEVCNRCDWPCEDLAEKVDWKYAPHLKLNDIVMRCRCRMSQLWQLIVRQQLLLPDTKNTTASPSHWLPSGPYIHNLIWYKFFVWCWESWRGGGRGSDKHLYICF